MIKRKIKVNTIEKVKDFVNEVSKFDVSIDLGSMDGRYTVDAKSILGVFSLDLSRPLVITIHDDERFIKDYQTLLNKYDIM